MIEKIVLDYLTESLSVPAFMEYPLDNLESFVVIEKTGSRKTNHVNYVTIAVQSIAKSLEGAAILNEEVKETMESIVALDSIGSISLNSDYNFTNTQTKQYRYQSVYDLVFV